MLSFNVIVSKGQTRALYFFLQLHVKSTILSISLKKTFANFGLNFILISKQS